MEIRVLKIIIGETNINFGAIFENFAAQELHAHGYTLYYFNSKKQGELDFVVEHDGRILPIEIKSGKDYKRHNALSNVMANAEYDIRSAIMFSNGNYEVQGRVDYWPVYMLMYLQPTAFENPVFVFKPM